MLRLVSCVRGREGGRDSIGFDWIGLGNVIVNERSILSKKGFAAVLKSIQFLRSFIYTDALLP